MGNYGYAYVPDGLADVMAVSARKHQDYSMALKDDGTVVAWGGAYENDIPAGLSDVTAISGGGTHSLALRDDGTVVAWGSNNFGESDVPPGLAGVQAVAAGGYGSLALKANGTVVAWGNTHGLPAGLQDVTAIASGGAGDLALKEDGTIVSSTGYPIPRPPTGLGGVTAISVGSYHGLAMAAVTPPPGPVETFTASPGDGRVFLSWANPADTDFWHTRILRSTTGFADGPYPDGDQSVIYYTPRQSAIDDFAHNGETYYYTAFARDAAGGWSERATASATPRERVRPTIFRTSPEAGATGTARDRPVVARFSEPMDPASLDTATVALRQQGTSQRLAATVTYDDSLRRVLLDPVDLLAPGATYTAIVTTAAKDLAGNRLEAPLSWTFTVTDDGTPPAVLSTDPAGGATGVSTDALITATFSEEMRPRPFGSSTVRLRRVGSAAELLASVSYDAPSRTVTLDPLAELDAGATYVAQLTRSLRDVAGNGLAQAVTWRFTVAD